MLNVFNVWENKGFSWIETERNNVFYVVDTHSDSTFWSLKLKFRSVDVFLIVCDLNYERNIKCILQILGKDKWNSMTEMKSFSTWSTSSVKVERLFLFVGVQNLFQISLTEEYTSSNKPMHRYTR